MTYAEVKAAQKTLGNAERWKRFQEWISGRGHSLDATETNTPQGYCTHCLTTFNNSGAAVDPPNDDDK